MCFKNLFKKKESADSLFAKRATDSIVLAENMLGNLNVADKVAIKDILRQIETEMDRFTDIPAGEVDKIFNNLNVILNEIKDASTGKARFANGKMSVHTLQNSIKSYIDILKFYVTNNVKKGSFRLKDGEIDDILKAATAIAALEEVEIRMKDSEKAIRESEDKAKELDSQIAVLEHRMKYEPNLSDFDLDRLEREIDRLDSRLGIAKEQIDSNTLIYDDSVAEMEEISRYQMMLERFLAGETLAQDVRVTKVHKDGENLGDKLTEHEIKKGVRRDAARENYEKTRVNREKKTNSRAAAARAARAATQKNINVMAQDDANFDMEETELKH